MKQLLLIATDEWRYWLRSRLAFSGALIFIALIAATSVLNTLHVHTEHQTRALQQTEAEETFYSQPDRHPHRMVHYGHYLFRTPAPLARFDPGLDPVTGQSIFLEGHHQNTVMFPESAASADLGGLSWLNPALVYQLFAPLILILLGHGAVVRERESSVLVPMLAAGISGLKLIFGKLLALLSFIVVLLLPLVASCAVALFAGENVVTLVSLLGIYAVYLLLWTSLTLIVSSSFKKRSLVLAILIGLWLAFTLVLPSIAVNFATQAAPLAGKIETDLKMQSDLRKLGDGHNANDPAFQQMRAELLEKHNVQRIEDLPMNFRGLVAMTAEEKLSTVLNRYAQSRMSDEKRQEDAIAKYAVLTPVIAIAFASRSIAGTDLEHYHRFQEQAEGIRYNFVQGLNRAHVEALSYEDDMNRNKDEASWLRARVDASNWKVLDTFQFQTASVSERLARASFPVIALLAWSIVMFAGLFWSAGRIKP